MINRKPVAILFDYGNTILFEKSEQHEEIALAYIFSQLKISSEHEMNLLEERYKRVHREKRVEKHKNFTEYSWQATTQYIFSDYVDRKLIDQSLEYDYWRIRYNMVPTPGIESLLIYLSSRKIRTGIVSNSSYSSSTLEKGLADNRIGMYFDFVISSADCGIRKPNSYMLDLARDKLALKAEEIWYIGDTIDVDIVAAYSAGFFPVLYEGITKTQSESKEFLIVQDWTELRDTIDIVTKTGNSERKENE